MPGLNVSLTANSRRTGEDGSVTGIGTDTMKTSRGVTATDRATTTGGSTDVTMPERTGVIMIEGTGATTTETTGGERAGEGFKP